MFNTNEFHFTANSKRGLCGAGRDWRNRPSGLRAETSIRRWVFNENGWTVRMCSIHCFFGQIRGSRGGSSRPVSSPSDNKGSRFHSLSSLFRWNVFRTRLFRESCVYHGGNYVKDLNKLGRDLQKIVIVDNSPASYIFHPENAVSVYRIAWPSDWRLMVGKFFFRCQWNHGSTTHPTQSY